MMTDDPSTELLTRFELADARYLSQRLVAANDGIVGERFGDAVVFIKPEIPADYFNRVSNFGAADLARLDEIQALFAERNVTCRIDVCEEHITPELIAALTDAGLGVDRHISVLAGPASCESPRCPDGIEIIEVVDREQFAAFIAMQQEAYGLPAEYRQVEPFLHWLDQPDWLMLLATHHGKQCAAAILYREDELAYLAAAATIPGARGLGIHQTLIRHRMHHAAAHGATIAFGHTETDNASQRNMQRCGLKLVGMKQVWKHTRD